MDQLKQWLESALPQGASLRGALHLTGIAGDAGFRQYYRLNSSPGLLAVTEPVEHSSAEKFINKREALAEAGIRVPQVYAVDLARGYMLQEDLGDSLLLASLREDNVDRYYDQCEAILLRLQQAPPRRTVFDDYSERELARELLLFPEWFLEKNLGLKITPEENIFLAEIFQNLINNAKEQPQVVVHRDFHSRNIIVENLQNNLAVIDFQDAVIGPITYDLVSLLRDCYIRWPADKILQRVSAYQRKLEKAGLLVSGISDQQFGRWFDWMGLQRHLKVLGIFSRLWLRDDKPGYLSDLPLVFSYVLEQAGSYSELAAFRDWLEHRVQPRLTEQSWFSL